MLYNNLSNSQVYNLTNTLEKTYTIDLLTSFMQMKIPVGDSYVMKTLSPSDLEYKYISQALLLTASAQCNSEASNIAFTPKNITI